MSEQTEAMSDRGQVEQAAVHLAAIVGSSDDAIISKTLDGIITSWNPAAERMFGFTAAEAIGEPITIIIPPERRDEEKEVLSQIRRGETVHHFETVRVRRDGTRIDLSLTVSPVRNAAGEVIGASKIARDISERKQAEEERAVLLVRERVARAEAEEASRAKDEFLATLSHELRTPLNVMLGWVRMLRSGRLDDTQAGHALEIVERNIRAQTDLINDLLDVSRIVSGKLALDMRAVDLRPAVEAAVDAVRPSAESKGVELRAILEGGALRTVGDEVRLQQLALNLLTNAVKFTPSGGRITIRLESSDDRARLIVSDTGEGISREVLPHVFDRVRQQERSTTRGHGGLGLGLTLARRLVDLHGGSIAAASEGPGRGATFTVELPLRPPDAGSRQPAAKRGEAALARLDLIRVLIVDDHADSRELLSLVLSERGATVVSAGSVVEAHRLVTRFRPDVVLTDISMPGEDGFRLLDWVRQEERAESRSIPVIAVTAHARSEDRQRILVAGFKEYLSKPVEVSDVVGVIRSLTRRTQRGQA